MHTIKTIATDTQLLAVMCFSNEVLYPERPRDDFEETPFPLSFWQEQWRQSPSLCLYAEEDGEIIGCVSGRAGNGGVIVGPLAVSPRHQRKGVGRALMCELEERTRALGIHEIYLGSFEPAESFYLSCGYHPRLFIQCDTATLDELRAVNTKYREVGGWVQDGWARLMLMTPTIDRELQHRYNELFPGCCTQTVFYKKV